MLIKNSVIWVTGGTSGIGKGCVEYFAARGAKVIFSGRRAEKGRAIEAELGENVMYVQGDVTVPEDNAAVAEAAIAKWGRLDILCNFAGASKFAYSLFDDDSLEKFKFEIETCLTATFDVTRVAAKHMLKNEPNEIGERGCIINCGSFASLASATRGNYGYKASKEGVRGLTRVLAVELGDHGIRVNTILPGFIRSEITEGRLNFEHVPNTIFPHYIGEPEHIAMTCQLFIENPLMNKTDIIVDGGLTGRY